MTALFESGRIVDLILLVVALEAAALAAWRGRAAQPLLITLLPGIALMLALRGALVGAAWPWIAAALALGGLLHLWDVRNRLP